MYRFENGGTPEYFIGSADWMRRNLDKRVEVIVPVVDPSVQQTLEEILHAYRNDNASVWECQSDGSYVRRTPPEGAPHLVVQEELMRRTEASLLRAQS